MNLHNKQTTVRQIRDNVVLLVLTSHPQSVINFVISMGEAVYDPTTDTVEKIIEQVYRQQPHDVLEERIAMLPEQQQFVIRQKYY